MGRRRKHPKHKQKTPKWYQTENDWGDYVFDWTLGLGIDTWREIFAILILLFSVVLFLGFFDFAGEIGAKLSLGTRKIFGSFPSYILPLLTFWLGVILLFPNKKKQRVSQFLGFILLIVFLTCLIHLFVPSLDARQEAISGNHGGILGFIVSDPLRNGLGLFAAFLVSTIMVVISIMMIFNVSKKSVFGSGESPEGEEGGNINVNQPSEQKLSFFQKVRNRIGFWRGRLGKGEDSSKAPVIEIEPKRVSGDTNWQMPPISILEDSDDVANPGNIQKNVETIKRTLKNFEIDIIPQDVNIGPTVTQYTFKPADKVKLNQITARANDLALALASKNLRIEAPIPGKSVVGVENPNKIPAKVTLREVMSSDTFKKERSKLAIALGRDVAGTAVAIDLEKMPHLLIAGATGSGKSVCINSIITTFLFNNSPEDLRLILVDPKRVELTNYNEIPHLLSPVIIDTDKTISSLKWAIIEMERRYRLFSDLGRRNITAYNQSPGPEGKLPYVVIVIDELADLMAQAARDVEGSIVRLAQMARATGINLIVATQRPSVDVITGLIKANITARIAFATASQVDSRTIIDLSGAEKLLGNGDMLFIGNGLSKPKRIQGCFVSDKEIDNLVKFLKNQSPVNYDESLLNFKAPSSAGLSGVRSSAEDDMYEDAVRVVTEAGKASASLLQRRLRIGYARAARLLDILEENGVIGPAEGAKPRDILMSPNNADIISNAPENNPSGNRNNPHF